MKHSEILTNILASAEKMREENDFKYVSPALIVAACSEFQAQVYTGLSECFYPERFEEERLRLGYKLIFKLSVSKKSFYIRKISADRQNLDIPFSFNKAEEIAKLRDKEILSADYVLLCAFSLIPSEYRFCLPQYKTEFDVIDLLTQIDANIYNYVINLGKGVVEKVNKKINEAIYLRDWRPKEKFVEPKELSHIFFDAVKTEYSNKILNINVPSFFDGNDLNLSLHYFDEVFYVTDNGSCIDFLSKRVDEQKLNRILKKVVDNHWLKNGAVVGFFTTFHQFFYYLQRLIFIAWGDLVYTKNDKKFYRAHREECDYIDSDKAQDFDYQKFLSEFKKHLYFRYDENVGLIFSVDSTYANFSTCISFQIETNADKIIISDRHKGNIEGEIFESFYWDHDDIMLYEKFIKKFLKPFNAELIDKNVYLIDNKENWLNAQFRFINLAVLLSEAGHNINLPK